ncbi:MAG: DNA repair protein RecN [Desulfarculus sp.]|nr:MAG: DNA repair protein RecN [Desulfarculus sp.]
MLTYLAINNFALIQSLELEPGPGLCVLTGETGAGKSIILAAVSLLIGQRAASEQIRQGAEQAVLEAQFALEEHSDPLRRLAQEGLPDGAGELVVRRLVSREGRNRVQVNGALSTLGFLVELGPELVSVVGQHASQALLRPEEHLSLLDAFAGREAGAAELAAAVARVRELDHELAGLEAELAARLQRRQELQETVAQLEAANLDPAEEEALKAERQLLANAEQVAGLAEGAHQGLYAAEGSILEQLGKVRGLLEDLARLDERVRPLLAQAEEAYFNLEDAARQVRDYATGLTFEPGRQDWVEGRLVEIRRLTRRFGGDVPAALQTLAEARHELEGLETGGQRLAQMRVRRREALDGALALAQDLSAARQEAAQRLAQSAQQEVADLGLADCRFQVRFSPPGGQALDTPAGPLSARGLERAEFFMAPNPGEGFRPLARIASGGELSRLLLALRSLVARRHGAPTLIFDEVDAGIGGAVGSAVGRKLAGLAREGQVICITHLPQIAAWADQHLAVEKRIFEGRTATQLRPLDEEGRLAELSRMLAGAEEEATARQHARQLMDAARREKKKF